MRRREGRCIYARRANGPAGGQAASKLKSDPTVTELAGGLTAGSAWKSASSDMTQARDPASRTCVNFQRLTVETDNGARWVTCRLFVAELPRTTVRESEE